MKLLRLASPPLPHAWLADRAVLLHVGVLGALLLAQSVLSDYAILSLARVMVLAVYAVGYNILFGYAGLLSLGHAMLFAAGLYGAGLSAGHLSFGAPAAFLAGIGAGFAVSAAFGLIALRTSGVAFMIVTLMFAQAGYLTSLYFAPLTRGDEGFVLRGDIRRAVLPGGLSLDLTNPVVRYNLALALLAICILGCLALVRSPTGRVLVAIRENEERTRMLGYDTQAHKLLAFVVSGTVAAAAGAAYALLFAYVGATFASIQYSILPLLWVLLGGAGTVLGPLVGTLLMFYLVDVTSGYTSAYMLVVGVALLVLVVWFPKGLLGTLREGGAVAAVSLLSTSGLSRHFGGLRAVDDVSFELDQGEVRAIIGPNGAGKSTFVGLICGRIAPTAGRIVFEGRDITDLPAHRRVGLGIAYTFQITSIYGNLTVFDNVALAAQSSTRRDGVRPLAATGLAKSAPMEARGLTPSSLEHRVGEALDRVGLPDRHAAKASALAYGHQRLLEVAMGLALAPKLLILDEPTQGLSDGEIAGFCDLIRAIARDATVLLIEHNMDVVMQLAGRITVMNNGAILSEGTPAEIRADAAVQRAYLGT